jgi:hypothetical protein
LEFHLESGFYLASFFAAIGILSGTFAAQLLLFFALFFFLITGCFEVISIPLPLVCCFPFYSVKVTPFAVCWEW